MAEHVVKWKFEANTTLNNRNEDTPWYHQFHPNRDDAIGHYISLLKSGVDGIVVDIFRMTRLPKD